MSFRLIFPDLISPRKLMQAFTLFRIQHERQILIHTFDKMYL